MTEPKRATMAEFFAAARKAVQTGIPMTPKKWVGKPAAPTEQK